MLEADVGCGVRITLRPALLDNGKPSVTAGRKATGPVTGCKAGQRSYRRESQHARWASVTSSGIESQRRLIRLRVWPVEHLCPTKEATIHAAIDESHRFCVSKGRVR